MLPRRARRLSGLGHTHRGGGGAAKTGAPCPVRSGVLVSKGMPPIRAAQDAAIEVILIGLLFLLVLLFRARGLIGEAAVVSRHVND